MLALALLLAAPAAPQDVPEALTVPYACAGGDVLAVAYINPPGGPPTRSSSTTASSSR